MDYQKSECLGGLLHDYQIAKTHQDGVTEICKRCKDRQFFHNKVPNHYYIQYHLRQCLQSDDPRFKKEYNR